MHQATATYFIPFQGRTRLLNPTHPPDKAVLSPTFVSPGGLRSQLLRRWCMASVSLEATAITLTTMEFRQPERPRCRTFQPNITIQQWRITRRLPVSAGHRTQDSLSHPGLCRARAWVYDSGEYCARGMRRSPLPRGVVHGPADADSCAVHSLRHSPLLPQTLCGSAFPRKRLSQYLRYTQRRGNSPRQVKC
jgi:hypothetical protein